MLKRSQGLLLSLALICCPNIGQAKQHKALTQEFIEEQNSTKTPNKKSIKEQSINTWQQHRQLESLINKSKNDLRVDSLLQKHLGTAFKRSSIYDLYPLEPYDLDFRNMDEASKLEFLSYFDYARKELLSVSQGPLLRCLHYDFDLDGKSDYAVIVSRLWDFDSKGLPRKSKHKDRHYLLVANDYSVLYFQPLKADYLEIINNGRYPTSLIINKQISKIPSIAFRVLALDGESYILYYDRNKAAWLKTYTDSKGDGG